MSKDSTQRPRPDSNRGPFDPKSDAVLTDWPLSTNQMVSKVGKVNQEKFLKTFWAQSVQKVDCFQKLGLAIKLGLGLGLAFQGVK